MLTFGSLSEIKSPKTIDNDKKLNFEQSISYTPDPATLKSSGSYSLTKKILQKPFFFNDMAIVNISSFCPISAPTRYGHNPKKS